MSFVQVTCPGCGTSNVLRQRRIVLLPVEPGDGPAEGLFTCLVCHETSVLNAVQDHRSRS
jgi:hypothetical protein